MLPVAIVIPIYKNHPSTQEIYALHNNFTILNDYPKYIIAPTGFNFEEYGDIFKSSEILHLPPHWFKSLNSYNRLMLTKMFYKLFLNYEYILILQPDALVFKNELHEWCSKGYSYIGAPWPNGKLVHPYSFHGYSFLRKLLPFFNKPKKCFVGNGGLSLRHVKGSQLILQRHFLANKLWNSQEDYFWAYYFLHGEGNGIVPSEVEASKFSLELNARQYYINNGCILPFGCHAYEKYSSDFWSEVIL